MLDLTLNHYKYKTSVMDRERYSCEPGYVHMTCPVDNLWDRNNSYRLLATVDRKSKQVKDLEIQIKSEDNWKTYKVFQRIPSALRQSIKDGMVLAVSLSLKRFF